MMKFLVLLSMVCLLSGSISETYREKRHLKVVRGILQSTAEKLLGLRGNSQSNAQSQSFTIGGNILGIGGGFSTSSSSASAAGGSFASAGSSAESSASAGSFSGNGFPSTFGSGSGLNVAQSFGSSQGGYGGSTSQSQSLSQSYDGSSSSSQAFAGASEGGDNQHQQFVSPEAYGHHHHHRPRPTNNYGQGSYVGSNSNSQSTSGSFSGQQQIEGGGTQHFGQGNNYDQIGGSFEQSPSISQSQTASGSYGGQQTEDAHVEHGPIIPQTQTFPNNYGVHQAIGGVVDLEQTLGEHGGTNIGESPESNGQYNTEIEYTSAPPLKSNPRPSYGSSSAQSSAKTAAENSYSAAPLPVIQPTTGNSYSHNSASSVPAKRPSKHGGSRNKFNEPSLDGISTLSPPSPPAIYEDADNLDSGALTSIDIRRGGNTAKVPGIRTASSAAVIFKED